MNVLVIENGDLEPNPKQPVSKLLLIFVLSPNVENTFTIVALLIPGPKSLNAILNSSSNILFEILISNGTFSFPTTLCPSKQFVLNSLTTAFSGLEYKLLRT